MNLEDDLRKLFADKEAFDVPVAADATDTVVQGARRVRRRRRVVAGGAGAVSMVVLIGIGVAAAGTGGVSGAPPAGQSLSVATAGSSTPSSTVVVPPVTDETVASRTITYSTRTHPHTTPHTTTTQPTNAEPAPPGNPASFGPSGFDGLSLGMSTEDAEATGVITPNVQPSGGQDCAGYDYTNFPRAAGDYSVIIAGDSGVVRLTSLTNAVTPEGIFRGVSLATVRATYADGTGSDAEWDAPVPGNPQARYEFLFDTGRVTLMRLEIVGGACLT